MTVGLPSVPSKSCGCEIAEFGQDLLHADDAVALRAPRHENAQRRRRAGLGGQERQLPWRRRRPSWRRRDRGAASTGSAGLGRACCGAVAAALTWVGSALAGEGVASAVTLAGATVEALATSLAGCGLGRYGGGFRHRRSGIRGLRKRRGWSRLGLGRNRVGLDDGAAQAPPTTPSPIRSNCRRPRRNACPLAFAADCVPDFGPNLRRTGRRRGHAYLRPRRDRSTLRVGAVSCLAASASSARGDVGAWSLRDRPWRACRDVLAWRLRSGAGSLLD